MVKQAADVEETIQNEKYQAFLNKAQELGYPILNGQTLKEEVNNTYALIYEIQQQGLSKLKSRAAKNIPHV